MNPSCERFQETPDPASYNPLHHEETVPALDESSASRRLPPVGGFFRSGELVVASESGFNSAVHLNWGDVAVNDPAAPTTLKIHLRRSKCGKGVDVFVGRSGNELCPIDAIVAYSVVRSIVPRAHFPVIRKAIHCRRPVS